MENIFLKDYLASREISANHKVGNYRKCMLKLMKIY